MCRIYVLLVSVLIMGCDGSYTDTSQIKNQNRQSTNSDVLSAPLKSHFLIKDKFDQEADVFIVGDEISFELDIKNISEVDVAYQATPPINSFIVKKEGEEIWSQHNGMMFMQAMTVGKIAPNDSLIFTAKWSGKDNEDVLLQPGRYEVFSNLVLFVGEQAIEVPNSKWIVLN